MEKYKKFIDTNHKKSIVNALSSIKVNVNTIVALYKIRDVKSDNTVIYNISYINNEQTTYICPSGSMKSSGGEYREGILNWSNFNTFLDKPTNSKLKEMYTDIQSYLKNALVERKLDFYIEYPNFVGALDVNPIDHIKIFSITWFNFYCDLLLDLQPNKLNTEFIAIMKMHIKEDSAFFKDFIHKFKDDCATFRYICCNIMNSSKMIPHDINKIGQKITILYDLELKNIHDFKYNIWKEIAINERVSKLVMDNITNGFSLMGPHFLIKTNKIIKLFDNPEQYKKIIQSEIANSVKDLLDKAISVLNTSTSKHNKPRKHDKHHRNKKYIDNVIASNDYLYARDYTENDEFWLLRNNIKYDKNHAENFIISNTAINMISEHSGRTFYDVCSDINGTEIFADSEFVHFNKYMFELCYNLYCLNTKVHCIHRDLHLNNIIISPLFNDKAVVGVTDPKILFIIGKQKFIFPNNFHNMCLIDFNISIINPEPFLTKQDITETDKLLDIQIENLLYYLYSIKPEYEEYDQFLKGNAKYYFDTYFKILSVLDIYNICAKFLSFIKLNKKKFKKLNVSKSKALVEAILKLSDYYITVIFDELINTNDHNKFKKMEWPILSIINSIFAENVYKSGSESSITDVIKF